MIFDIVYVTMDGTFSFVILYSILLRYLGVTDVSP